MPQQPTTTKDDNSVRLLVQCNRAGACQVCEACGHNVHHMDEHCTTPDWCPMLREVVVCVVVAAKYRGQIEER